MSTALVAREGPVEYRSGAQQARVLTEGWLAANGFCPNCNSSLTQTPNNTRVLDFQCGTCRNDFELKSKNGRFGAVIPDGAYGAMVRAIREDTQPNLFLLSYARPFVVTSLDVVPRRFLVEPIVIKRKPLSPTARRAGWVGCNLNLALVPKSALIACFVNGLPVERTVVRAAWKQTAVLEEVGPKARGWLAVTLGIVERMPSEEFSLADVYAREATLPRLFPHNRHIRPKLRQQLQVLRDMGLLTFLGSGRYRAVTRGAGRTSS